MGCVKLTWWIHAQDREDPKVHPGEAAHMFFFQCTMPPSTPHILEGGAYVVLSILPTVCWHIFSRRAKNSPSCVTLSKDWHRLWLHCTEWKWVSDPWNRTTLKILEAVAFWTICWVAYWFMFCIDLAICFYLMDSTLLVSLCKCTVYFNFYAFTVCFLWFAVHGLIFVCMGYLCRCFNVFNVLLELFHRAILEPSTCDRSTGPFEAAIPRAAGQR